LNEGVRPTKTYDIEPTAQGKETDFSKPIFVNQEISGTNLKELNLNEDLYMKNVRQRGLDVEAENNQGEVEGENKRKRVFNKEKRPYQNNNNKNYQNRPRFYNKEEPKPEKEFDEDGFEKVVIKPKRNTPYNNNYNRNRGERNHRQDDEQRVWESVTEQAPREERGNEENNDLPEGERPQREERPREQREKRERKGQKKENTVWETEPQIKEKQIEVVKPQQPTKVEITVVK
jgi:hypothetical protein